MKKILRPYFLLLVAMTLTSCAGGDDGLENSNNGTQVTHEDDDDNQTAISDAYTYQLPIVFHVLYKDATDSTQYIPQSRLAKIVGYLNELYAGNVYGDKNSANVRVNFRLATMDEKGNLLATPGVEYVQWTGEYPVSPETIMYDNEGTYKKYIWEPNDYINVLLYHFAPQPNEDEGILLGLSHMPYTVKGDSSLVGLTEIKQTTLTKSNLNYAYCSSINSKYIWEESSRYADSQKGARGYTYKSNDVVVTMAHELGHYLGLHHAFTESDNQTVDSCGDTDFCDDTPSYNRVEYNDWLANYLKTTPSNMLDLKTMIKRIPCSGENFSSENVMDYSVGLGYRFTNDQKQRMRHVLTNSPLIPGPKATRSSRSADATDEVIDLPIVVARTVMPSTSHPSSNE